MSANAALNRVNTVDFFTVVIPGVYFVANIALFGFWFIDRSKTEETPWRIIGNAVTNLPVNGLLILLLAAFLLGSTARAFPVKTVDTVSGWINKLRCVLPCWRRLKSPYSQEFPYNPMLEDIFGYLKQCDCDFTEQCAPAPEHDPEKKRIAEFNYWKVVICCDSPELFALIRAAEARVRMFAGIIWATGWSCVVSTVAVALPPLRQWYEPFVTSAMVSLVLCVVFLVLLRSMRREEVRAVYYGFLALNRKTSSRSETGEHNPNSEDAK
jgi:hypothetical protein